VEPLIAHQRAQDAFAGVLANVSPDQLGAPTPCSEWTIRDLIEHVIGGNEHVGIWSGSDDEPPARPDDTVAAHRATAAAAQDVFARPDGMSTMFKLPFGEIPGQIFIGMRTSDVLTHAWDLAVATNQPTDLDPELAAEPSSAGPASPSATNRRAHPTARRPISWPLSWAERSCDAGLLRPIRRAAPRSRR
jgi:uncharacterized protein (TIGR03086 family)